MQQVKGAVAADREGRAKGRQVKGWCVCLFQRAKAATNSLPSTTNYLLFMAGVRKGEKRQGKRVDQMNPLITDLMDDKCVVYVTKWGTRHGTSKHKGTRGQVKQVSPVPCVLPK